MPSRRTCETTLSSARLTSGGGASSGDRWRSACYLSSCSSSRVGSASSCFSMGIASSRCRRNAATRSRINRHLRLEIETLKSPQRIERLATSKLHLVTPGTGAAIVIERVVPDEPPSAAVIARSEWSAAAPPLDASSARPDPSTSSGSSPAESRDERSRGTQSDAPSAAQAPPDQKQAGQE